MEKLSLKATQREILRKKVRFLRRQGITPIHVFGSGIESLTLQCDTAQIIHIISRAGLTRPITLTVDKDKEAKTVFIREVQKDVFGKELLHVDLYQVKKGQTIKVDVPIVFVGEAPAMKGKGRIIIRGLDTLSIECLPEKLPNQIEVDLSPLVELDQSLFVKNIILDPEIKVFADPEQMLVKVSEIIVREEVPIKAAAEAVPAEGEAAAEGAPAGEAGAAAPAAGAEAAPPKKEKS
ncbi:MAG: 50S ribosomal protein L25 [Dehalococcoidales bacterium]|nr:50S ribosomal protein L25 [Dehalococcoidales bacterium]